MNEGGGSGRGKHKLAVIVFSDGMDVVCSNGDESGKSKQRDEVAPMARTTYKFDARLFYDAASFFGGGCDRIKMF